MSKEKKKPNLDMEICYSGFKIDELEYIGYSRATEDQEDDFLDTFTGKLDDGISSTCGDDDDDDMLALGEFGSSSFVTDGYRSYLCSTPTAGRKHRGSFPQEADMSAFTEPDYRRNFPTKLNINQDSGVQTQSISAANSVGSFFGDENISGAGSLESLPGSGRSMRDMAHNLRKRIELDSDLHDPYSNVDELELSIEEEMTSQIGNTSTLGTLKRRLSLKVIRRNISTGLFGSYLQRTPALTAPPTSSQSQEQLVMSSDQAQLLNNMNKPTGPVNLWFRKFRNRHFI